MDILTIGKLAKRAGVGVETVRYYEREKLLKLPGIGRSGFREYPDSAVDRIIFIRNAKSLGFKLREIKEILDISESDSGASRRLREAALMKLSEIDKKIRMLQNIKDELIKITGMCDGKVSLEDCPIMKSLKGE